MVPLTTAGLAGVEPADAGAASGLVNVTQQVGAALGLAVLVTVLGRLRVMRSCEAGGAATATVVHGLDVTFRSPHCSDWRRWSWWRSWSICPRRRGTRPSPRPRSSTSSIWSMARGSNGRSRIWSR